MRTMTKALLTALLLVLFLVASNMDYHDEVQSEQHTCAMIEAGHWPAAMAPYCDKEGE